MIGGSKIFNKYFDTHVISTFESIKDETYKRNDFNVPIYRNDMQIALLKPITKSYLEDNKYNREIIRSLAEWRNSAASWYPTIFKVTEEGTKKWLEDQVIGAKDRLLFMAETLDGIPFGHMGLYRGEADNFLRGRKDILNGGMTLGLSAMLNWAFCDLELKELHLRVFSDNQRAINFYKRCGFKEISKIPLEKIEEGNRIKWEELPENCYESAERFFSVMYLKNPF